MKRFVKDFFCFMDAIGIKSSMLKFVTLFRGGRYCTIDPLGFVS